MHQSPVTAFTGSLEASSSAGGGDNKAAQRSGDADLFAAIEKRGDVSPSFGARHPPSALGGSGNGSKDIVGAHDAERLVFHAILLRGIHYKCSRGLNTHLSVHNPPTYLLLNSVFF